MWINEHFEAIFNAVWVSAGIFQTKRRLPSSLQNSSSLSITPVIICLHRLCAGARGVMTTCIGTLEGINSAGLQAIDDGEVASRRVVRI
jgi:hypothetical protein